MHALTKFLTRIGRTVLWGILGIAIAALLFEGCLRFRVARARSDDEYYELPIAALIDRRIFGVWTERAKSSFLDPPFTAFANAGFDEPDRLAEIYPYSHLPPGTHAATNFLRDPKWANAHPYAAHINALGYRGPERAAPKPARTFRILCVGAYQTFGLGVADEQTWAAELERQLDSRHLDYRFEVWNAGGIATTAIMGYSRYVREESSVDPDLVFLEYGLLDIGTNFDFFAPGDDIMRRAPKPRLLRSSAKDRRTQLILRIFALLPKSSYLAYEIVNRITSAEQKNIAESERHYAELYRTLIGTVRGKGIPLIMLDQVNMVGPRRPRLYAKVAADNGVELWRTHDALTKYPPSPAELERFDRSDNFVAEFGTYQGRLRDKKWYPYRSYLGSYYQMSSEGHAALARDLADRIEAKIRSGELRLRIERR